MGSSRELGISRSGNELGAISWHGRGLLWTFAVGAGIELISCPFRTGQVQAVPLGFEGNGTGP